MAIAEAVEAKTIHITGKRQITIPQKFFELLGFSREAECSVRDGELVIRPIQPQQDSYFAEQILADLIDQGYEGQALLKQFRKTQATIRPAVEAMLTEAEYAAQHPEEFASYEDVFGDDPE